MESIYSVKKTPKHFENITRNMIYMALYTMLKIKSVT